MSSRPPEARASEIEPWRPPVLAASPVPALPPVRDIDIYKALLLDASHPNTQIARRGDMEVFAGYLGVADGARAAALLCGGTAGAANALALGFKRHMLDLGRSSSTVNRRLCTLRRLVTLARRLGTIDWTLEVQSLAEERGRDMAGPSHEQWLRMVAVAESRADDFTGIGARNLAAIRLLHDNGLRAGELVALDLADVDLAGERVAIVGKGKRAKVRVTINGPTARALAGWIALRGDWSGALFIVPNGGNRTLAPEIRAAREGPDRERRMDRAVLFNVVRDLGNWSGFRCWPHALRHSGATRLLDLTNGDLRAVQRWTRHKNMNTVMIYDDNRLDLAGKLTRRLGDDGAPAEGGGPPC